MDPNVTVDLIGQNGMVQGAVASKFQANGNLNIGAMRPFIHTDGRPYISVYMGGDVKDPKSYHTQMVANGTLRRDEWKTLDDALLSVARYRLGGIQDLESLGLVYNLANGMGTTVLEWHTVSGSIKAVMTMDGVNRGLNDRPNYKYHYLPIPIVHADYEISARDLALSRNMGNPLDTTDAEFATRSVYEQLENMLFTDTDYSFGEKDSNSRNTIYSYVNYPDRNLVSLNLEWNDSAKTGKQIVDDVNRMKAALVAKHQYGPYYLYVPTAYDMILDDDYSTLKNDNTIRERIMKIENIKAIKVNDTLEADNVLLVQMTPSTIRLVKGMGIQNLQWGTEGNLIDKHKIMTIQVPQIRSDQEGQCGIAHLA